MAEGATTEEAAPAGRVRKRAPTDTVVVFPSAALRPIPSFTIGVPAGWVVDEAPDCLGVLRVPAAVDGFWVNLLLAADRIDHRVKLAHAASITLDRLKAQSPDLEVVADRVASFDGRLMSVRVINLTAPKSGREITQVLGLTIAERAEGAKTRDLFHLTGTCARADVGRFGRIFVDTIASFRLV